MGIMRGPRPAEPRILNRAPGGPRPTGAPALVPRGGKASPNGGCPRRSGVRRLDGSAAASQGAGAQARPPTPLASEGRILLPALARSRWLLRRSLVALVLAAACLTLPAAPAAAHIFEVAVTDGNILDEGDGVPIDTLGAAQNLWVYVRADLQGGELCVVDADIDDPGTGALHCKRPAWGTRNRVANQAAGWILIEKPYLPAGQWRILGNGGDEPGDDVLSPEFTVQACTPGQCDRHFALEIAERYKARALDTADRLKDLGYGLTVAGNNTPSATGDEIVDAFKTYAVKPLYDHAPFLLRMGLDQGLSAGLDFIEGLAGSFWLGSLEGKMMALAKAINDRSEQMYRDIADDPPAPASLAAAPATPDPPQIAVGDEALDAALVTIDRMAADGEAGLTAYERFQGAVADGSDVGQHLQARAMADFDFRLADEMRAGADAYDAIATRLQAEPRFAALAVTQEQLDLIGPALERVAAQGFLPAERDQLTTLGLDDAAIAALRDDLSDLSLHLADVPVGVPVVDLLRAAASELRDSVGAVDAMARNATAVA